MKSLFTGCGTALITPFKGGEIDWDTLDQLVEEQIAGGVDALIATGTTGEPATMTWEEHLSVIRRVADRAAGRVTVIAGAGSNCTREAIIRDGRIIACDSVDALSKTNAKRVTVHGIISLEHLNGIRDRKETKDSVSFLYNGDMGSLLRILSSGQVDDLTVTEPDLEEVFLHYYEKDGETV